MKSKKKYRYFLYLNEKLVFLPYGGMEDICLYEENTEVDLTNFSVYIFTFLPTIILLL